MSLKVGENVDLVSNRFDPGKTQSYSASLGVLGSKMFVYFTTVVIGGPRA